MASAGAVTAGAAAAGGASAYRVLAFEDTYSMAQILGDGGVAYAQLEQKWTTKCACAALRERTLRYIKRYATGRDDASAAANSGTLWL